MVRGEANSTGEANGTGRGKWYGARQMARGETNGTGRGKTVLLQGIRLLERDRAVYESYSKSVGSPEKYEGRQFVTLPPP